MKKEGTAERAALWDNAKGIMILLVVLGHFTFYIADGTGPIQKLYFYIHIFHMPVFVFISGMFSRRTVNTGRLLKEKVLEFLFLGYLLKFAIALIKIAYRHFDKLEYFRESGLAWYMLAMAVWILVTWLLRDVDRRFLLAFSVLAAVLAGYDKNIGGDWSLSRIICFYPFFLLGLICTRETLEEWRRRIPVKAAAAVILAAVLVIVWKNYEVVYPFFDIIKGWRNYYLLEEPLRPMYGLCYRLGWYVTALAVGGAVITLTPAHRSLLTTVGSRSLPIYLFHRPVLYFLKYHGWLEFLERLWPAHWHVLYLLSAVLVTLILAHPVFEIPVNKLRALVRAGASGTRKKGDGHE